MDRTPVTVAQFAAFVRDAGYETSAERYSSGGVLDERQGAWMTIEGTNWRWPARPHESPAKPDYPVTQVSWHDASTFYQVHGARFPTEFEWERSARMGQTPGGHVFKIGDSIQYQGRYPLNAWAGIFRC